MPNITSGISSLGNASSSLDIRSIVQKLVEAEKRPIDVARRAQVKITEKLAAFSALRVNLSSLKATLIPLTTLGSIQSKSASTSDAKIITAVTDSSAILGSSTVNQILSLARANKLQSGRFTSPTDEVGTGTLKITIGEKETSIALDNQHKSLTGIRDKINAANSGVTASVLKLAEDDYRLLIQGNDSGLKNQITIEVADDDGNNQDKYGLSQLRYTSVASSTEEGGLTTVHSPQDALFEIDGVQFSRPTNTVADIIPGVTLTLHRETEANANVGLNVSGSSDSGITKGKIESFVTAYNNLMQALNTAQVFDSKTGQKGPLLGDAIARTITNRFHALVQGRVLGLKSAYTAISQLGLTSEKDGTLKIDSTRLDIALRSDPFAVSRLFAGDDTGTPSISGVADLTLKYVSSLQSVSTGEITLKEKGLKGSIATIESDVTRITKRVEDFERKTRERFAKLEGVLDRLTGVGSGLQSQLTQINSLMGSLNRSTRSR